MTALIRTGLRRRPDSVLGAFIAPKQKSKYSAVKVSVGGVKFDSKAEARRYRELLMLEQAGQICGLQRQVSFLLVPGVKFAGAMRARPAIRYIADFVYLEPAGRVIEDVKSAITRKLPVYRIKKHLMKHLLGLEIRETN